MNSQKFDYDVAFVGCGLANSLIALQLKQTLPHLRLVIIEQRSRLGGSQTWSFHANDLLFNGRKADLNWLVDFDVHVWNSYEVRFPDLQRQLAGPYYALRSERFAAVVTERLQDDLRLGQALQSIDGHRLCLNDGSSLTARLVIDGRGWSNDNKMSCGYQKFVGLLVKLKNKHGLDLPIIMDADLPQLDGFRFIYTLPFSVDTLLIEDTRYSSDPQIDRQSLRQEIHAYAARNNWEIKEILDEEIGCLPIPLRASWNEPELDEARVYSGLSAGHFHPVTGYSIGPALEFSAWVANELRRPEKDWDAKRFLNYSKKHWQAGGFYRRLNNMMFLAASAEKRYLVLERFYRHDEALIARFYAQRLTWWDRFRMLSGKPPVPLGRGISAFFRNIGVEHDIEKDRAIGQSR